MSRLETEINQIFLTHSENKNISQILYDEELREAYHLFLLAEIRDIKRKSEAEELKKITDIILNAFRSLKKLPAETLFESALAQINQNLASLAQKGQKSWLGKFSALIAFKSPENIFLSNIGQTSVWLKRKTEVSEILAPEKKSKHPLRTFQNFMTGKIKEEDSLILTTSNVFNYISLPLFLKTLASGSLAEACMAFSNILKDSSDASEAFASFMLKFTKEQEVVQEAQQPVSEAYSPLPEEEAPPTRRRFADFVPKLSFRFKLPAINLFGFKNLSRSRQFFLASFLIFVLIFGVNVAVYGMRLQDQKRQEKIGQQADKFLNGINEAESALIYKNWNEALRLLEIAEAEYENLNKLDPTYAMSLFPALSAVRHKINRVSIVAEPKIFLEFKYDPMFLARAGSGFLVAGKDEKSITFFDGNQKLIFLLNKPDGEITGIAHVSNLGHLISSSGKIYRINEQQKLLEVMQQKTDGQFWNLKHLSPNRVYTLDQKNGQVLRLTISNGTLSAPQAILANSLPGNPVDFGVDKDVYVLYPAELKRFVSGLPDSFELPNLSEPVSDAQRLFVAANLYVLEPAKKRLLIFNKQGQLLNQIVFPNSQNLKDVYVDEQDRYIYLLDTNKLLQITF